MIFTMLARKIPWSGGTFLSIVGRYVGPGLRAGESPMFVIGASSFPNASHPDVS